MRSTTRRRGAWTGLAAGAGLVGLLAVGPARAADELSMEEIVSMLAAKQLGEVYEVEREHDGYEVKILEASGVWLVLYVDAQTGEILHEERSAPDAEHAPDSPDEADDEDEGDDEADDESEPDRDESDDPSGENGGD